MKLIILMEQQLREEQGFKEMRVPSSITDVVFRADAFKSLIASLKEGPEPGLALDSLGGITIDMVRDFIGKGVMDHLADENLLLAIRPRDFAPQLRSFATTNWDELKDIPLRQDCLKKHERTGIRKELSFSPYHEDKYPITHRLTTMVMSFYGKVQEVMMEDLSKRNFVVGADAVIKKNILRTNHPKGQVVKISDNPLKRETPLIIPPHPNFIGTKIFPFRRLNGNNRLMVLNEDISGAKRLDKMSYEEMPMEERLGAVLETMKACDHLHDLKCVHHDVKPSNMFKPPKNGSSTQWILGDPETVVEEGLPYPKNHRGPLFFATEEYLDATYYTYDKQVLSHTSKAVDIFAYALTIIEQYLQGEERFKEFCKILQDEKDWVIDQELIEHALKKVGCPNCIPCIVLDFLVQMLSYDRRSRPDIKRVYEVLSRHL